MSKRTALYRHWKAFIAPAAGVLAALFVMAILNAQYFIARFEYQYGRHAAQVSPLKAQSKAEEPLAVDLDPEIIIPTIGVDAPIVFGVASTAEQDIQTALQDGVVHYGDTADPGRPGNSVYFGHSSNAPWVPGRYNFVFTALQDINLGDEFYVNKDGKQYEYRVVSKKITDSQDATVLNSTDAQTATLITCTPVGTSLNRLVILGEQIHPAPVKSVAGHAASRVAAIPDN